MTYPIHIFAEIFTYLLSNCIRELEEFIKENDEKVTESEGYYMISKKVKSLRYLYITPLINTCSAALTASKIVSEGYNKNFLSDKKLILKSKLFDSNIFLHTAPSQFADNISHIIIFNAALISPYCFLNEIYFASKITISHIKRYDKIEIIYDHIITNIYCGDRYAKLGQKKYIEVLFIEVSSSKFKSKIVIDNFDKNNILFKALSYFKENYYYKEPFLKVNKYAAEFIISKLEEMDLELIVKWYDKEYLTAAELINKIYVSE